MDFLTSFAEFDLYLYVASYVLSCLLRWLVSPISVPFGLMFVSMLAVGSTNSCC